jgi:hypothetical protein
MVTFLSINLFGNKKFLSFIPVTQSSVGFQIGSSVQMYSYYIVNKLHIYLHTCSFVSKVLQIQYLQIVVLMKPLTVQALEVAVDNFVWRGESIAREFPEAAPDIMAAVADIRRSGAVLAVAARDFTADPCSAARRGVLVSAARALLAAVARLLILADMIDVHVLLQSVATARSDLEFVGRSASSEPELIEGMRRFNASSGRLEQLAGRRQADLKDREAAAGLAAARAVLKGQWREMVFFSLIASYLG